METRSRGTHLAVMCSANENAAGFADSIVAEFANWGITFGEPDEEGARLVLVDADQHLYGMAWLYDVKSASKHPPAETFLGYRSLCPFLCELAPTGFIEWVEFSEFQRASWLLPLIKVGKGLLVELSRRTLRPCVTERVFSLDNLGSKFGFEDGDVLLTRSMDDLQGYRARTADAIEKTLAEHGLDLHVYGPEWTSHNIFRVGSPLRTKQGETIEEEGKITRRLAAVKAKIWTYDLGLARDPALFP